LRASTGLNSNDSGRRTIRAVQAFAPWLAAFSLGGSPACAATPVHYEPGIRAGLPATPWISAGRGSSGFVGHLFYYADALSDSRVYGSRGAVVYAGGRTPAGGSATKILWVPRSRPRAGRTLAVTGRRLDAPGSFSQGFRIVPGSQFPSIVRVPSAGCWRLTLRSGRLRATVVLEAVEATAPGPACRPTAVQTLPNPVDPYFTHWIATTGASSPIYGTFSVFSDGVDGAAIYTGGRKVLWFTDGDYAHELSIRGRRLDAPGSFEQFVPMALSPAGFFPSIVNVPSAGCWLLTLRTGRAAGIAVVRAVAP